MNNEFEKNKVHQILKNIKEGFREFNEYKNILYPLDQMQFLILQQYIEKLEHKEQILNRLTNLLCRDIKHCEHIKEIKILNDEKIESNENYIKKLLNIIGGNDKS